VGATIPTEVCPLENRLHAESQLALYVEDSSAVKSATFGEFVGNLLHVDLLRKPNVQDRRVPGMLDVAIKR
jgi:hypothetical protein